MDALLLATYIIRELDGAAKLLEAQSDPKLQEQGKRYRAYAAASAKQVERMNAAEMEQSARERAAIG